MSPPQLPPGWSATREGARMVVTSPSPNVGFVKIDFAWRRFELGIRGIPPVCGSAAPRPGLARTAGHRCRDRAGAGALDQAAPWLARGGSSGST